MHARMTIGEISGIRKPGRYGDRMFLVEHKLCPTCQESETRLDARFCCWCGAAFSVVVIEAVRLVTVRITTPIGGTTAQPRTLPPPTKDE